ncbi:hypothetical protein N802_13180 [Knoellia sinensis KCTC 19936]|uniref:Mucin n=1 Tax=Knoellia sinensis KCTC 19936 TaxID=1385520 RepID=A0A0A0JCB0_9MICO|nr:hypothetical protein N802_13180 [Knoellia sinensis KCTC 19936]
MTAAIIAGVVLLAGGGAWAVGSMLNDDPSGDAAPATATAAASATTSGSGSGAGGTAPSEAPSTAASGTPEAADGARTDCVAQVKAAEDFAAAAKDSAAHWKTHTDAYLAKTSGRITLEETAKLYADSKAFGLADEKAIAATTKAFQATGTACADAAKEAAGDATITACTTRLAALDKVRTTGTTVQNEWSAHLRMMANKAHTEMGSYHNTWVKAVDSAQKSIPAYQAAADAVGNAPACA